MKKAVLALLGEGNDGVARERNDGSVPALPWWEKKRGEETAMLKNVA